MKRTMMAACILSLVACGGSKDDVATDQRQDWESQRQSLVYSFPDNAQQEVPTSSPVVLRFSSPVRTGNAALHDKIVLRDSNNTKIEWADIEEVDNGQSLLLHPQQKLSPLTTYQLSIAPVELQKGETRARNLTFSTRAAYEGPKSLVADDEFTILRTLPNDLTYGATDTPVDIMEFTTFRVQFSQPLDRSTVKYGNVPGDSTVQLTGPDGLIDAHVIVSGPYLTIDPKEDLQPDVPHRITFTTGVKSIYGDTMPGGSFGNENDTTAKTIDFTPKATGPRGNMVQDIADTLGKVSPLTGRQINEVPMASVLLGEDTATQASGIVAAELAFVPDFPDATPLRVKRGSLIEGASIDVLIGGEVPAGFESGKVRMDFLSDATGYLLPNPYSDTDDAPRQVRLWMDVAVSTETPQANGAITQDLLHIELVGTSLVDPETKLMTINAVGVVEPNVLGSEYASGLLSFYMEEVGDQDNPPVMVEDTTGPVLQSWIPGENAHLHKPGDPIIFNFDEPIDPESVKGKVTLYKTVNGGAAKEISAQVYVDGAAIVVKPEEDLVYSRENSRTSYSIEIGLGITDVSGNTIDPLAKEMELPLKVENKTVLQSGNNGFWDTIPKHSPVVLSAYPGFPCALSEDGRDLSQDLAGRCEGGYPGSSEGSTIVREKDDSIPVMKLPSNRPIIVQFSKEMDHSSISLGNTFLVHKINENEEILENVSGTLNVTPRSLKFIPDQPWESEALYRYSILSSGYEIGTASGIIPDMKSSDNYECGVTAVCDIDGLPLQTIAIGLSSSLNITGVADVVYMTAPDFDTGGPTMEQFFRGASPNNNVVQVLFTSPISDVNHSFYNERNTPESSGTAGLGHYLYDIEEHGPTSEPDDRYPEYDPSGLRPGKNSAKVLSRYDSRQQNINFPYISGFNIGCAYDFNEKMTAGCPERVFSYLSSAMIAEVTNETTEDGLKVLLWPSQVIGTSLQFVAIQYFFGQGILNPRESGPQVLRMRFEEGDRQINGRIIRDKPIEAWIREVDGKPTLGATVDLYLNIRGASEQGVGGARNPTNMSSYPVEMTLMGPVEFLDDGRMVVEQFNVNRVEILLEVGECTVADGCESDRFGYADLFIPEYGSRLNFISEPIK